MKILFSFLIVGTFFILGGCTEPRVKTYEGILEPRVGKSKKDEIDKILGNPTSCQDIDGIQKCEYRSSRANNQPVPDVYRKQEGMGPDLSPYDRYDVLHLKYDSFGILKEWEPVVLSH